MRDIAQRFNARFGDEALVVPEHRIPAVGARIMDLQDPDEQDVDHDRLAVEGTVYVLDEPAAIEKKFKRAVTDSGERDPPRRPTSRASSNLIEILAVVRGRARPRRSRPRSESAAATATSRRRSAAAVVDYLAPVRERYAELRADEGRLEAILADGAERARGIAAETLADVRERMGVGAPRRRSTDTVRG